MSNELDLARLDRLLANLETALGDGTEAAAEVIVENMLQVCPVSDDWSEGHTHLVETIKHEAKGPTTEEISAGEGLPDDRAFFVEFGTVKMEAQPYFYVSAQQPNVEKAFAEAVANRLKV